MPRTASPPRVPRAPEATRPRGREGAPARDRRALLTVWLAWLALMTGANLAAPLYAVYATRFGFSSLVITLVFAVYALVLMPALLLFGRLSDRFGRRPIMLAGLAAACAGLALFAAASSTGWLFAARALQGLAVGMISGAATAALVELDPRADGRRPALLAGLAQAGGSALGPLVAGLLAEWAPAPLHLSYLVVLGATLVAAIGVARLPERARAEPEPWRIQVPRVPREIRGDFVRVSLTAALAWATVALSLSIVPSYAGDLLGTTDLALLGSVAAIALAASCVAQVVGQHLRAPRRRVQALGLVVLALGLGALVAAAPSGSLAVLILGALLSGGGHGLAFLHAQDELNDIAPAERRGEVTAAFICCIYLVVGGSVIATGLLDLEVSLSVAVEIVAVALAAGALATAAWQARRAA
jgi:MFS family permease